MPAPARADLHALDRAVPGPGTPDDGDPAPIDQPPPGEEVGDPGRDHARPDADPGDRLTRVVGVALVPIGRRLLVAVNGPATTSIEVGHFTLAIPYQPGTRRRAGAPCWGWSGSPFIAAAMSSSDRRELPRGPPPVASASPLAL